MTAVFFILLRLTAKTTARFVGSAVAKACLPRIPPPNWIRSFSTTKVALPSQTSHQYAPPRGLTSETTCRRCSQALGPSLLVSKGYDEVQCFFEEDVPIVFVGNPVDDSEFGDGDTTLCSIDSHLIDFSIYSDVSSPDLNKAMLISPARPTMPDVRDVGFTQLRAASDRVSEILRENRRRLDAGEDSNIARKEARRKRAQELSAARKARGGLF